MRCLTRIWIGALGLCCSTIADAEAQTDLFRFQPPPPVSVFRSTDSIPVTPSSAVPVTVVPPAATTFRVPVSQPAAPVVTFSPIVGPSPIVEPGPITVNYAPVTSWQTVDSLPNQIVTQWTPVEETVTSFSPVVVPGVPPNAFSNSPVVVQAAPTGAPFVTAASPTTWNDPNFTTVLSPVTTEQLGVPTTAVIANPAVGRNVVVRPKVYVQGQPIRNLFRAITP